MELTHLNEQGRARMVDVGDKDRTDRRATASATVRVNPETYQKIVGGTVKKGDVLSVAQVAGVMGAKRTPDIIPMCHPIAVTGIDIVFQLDDAAYTIEVQASARCRGETGVEMEALTAATVAALTIYDMCKAIQRDILIENIHLVEKSGGKSGAYKWEEKHHG